MMDTLGPVWHWACYLPQVVWVTCLAVLVSGFDPGAGGVGGMPPKS